MVDESNPMRLAKKAWNHLGEFTRQEAIEVGDELVFHAVDVPQVRRVDSPLVSKLLTEKLVSQKRRVLMKDCVRIIYYCHIQRSSGCRYEMSVCVPNNPDEKLRIDDFNAHTCNPEDARLRRRAKPQIEDFDKPIEKRKVPPSGFVCGNDDGSATFFPV